MNRGPDNPNTLLFHQYLQILKAIPLLRFLEPQMFEGVGVGGHTTCSIL